MSREHRQPRARHLGGATLLVLALVGCRDERIEYRRLELPGFSLEVPTSAVDGKDRVTEYRAGRVEMKDASRLVILSWRSEPIATVEELPQTIRAMTQVFPDKPEIQTEPARAIQIGGHDATQIFGRLETMKMSFTEIECGKRTVVVYVVARKGFQTAHDRILGSFDCRPIAAQEAAISAGAAPFGIDDPALLAGWYRVALDDQFVISNGDLGIFASQRPRGDAAVDMFDKVLPMGMGAAGGSWTSGRVETRQGPGGERIFHHGRMVFDGEAANAVATLWNCPGRHDAVMAFAMSESGAALDPAIELIAKLRCANPDDAPLPLAPAPAGPP